MSTRASDSLERFIRRCPKSGRITGFRFHSKMATILLPIAGALAVLWFLVRVIPKPSRAAYPCQRVAAGIGAGFLGYLACVALTYTGFWFLHRKLGRAVAVSSVLLLLIAGYAGLAISNTPADPKIVPVLAPQEGVNNPMGKGGGIYPGRVVWEQDFASTSWDGKSGRWWEDKNIDQNVVDRMFSKTIRALTGAKSDQQAWDRLFHYRNKAAGRGNRGYQKGQKVVVKLNCNADTGKPWDNRGYPSPQAVNTLVRQLIEVAGVPGSSIVLTDPSRMVGANIYDKVRSNPARDYQQVIFEGQNGDLGPQRVRPEPDMNSPICFDMPGGKRGTMYLPKSYAEAAYMINYGLMRPHRVFGVTLAAKNHFGSVYDTELKTFKPALLHAFAIWDYPTPNKQGQVHSHPDLLGHKHTGGKTILYFLDALYTSYNQGAEIVRWKSMGDRWFSSMLMSQDPVAIDSVAYDLITSEPNLVTGNPSFNGHVDSYLHESALAGSPPSKVKYDPENDGAAIGTLGVHEHWNSAAEKKYSRNLGKKEGIELLALN